MKTILLLILLMIPISLVWSADTTRIYCGDCGWDIAPYPENWVRHCDSTVPQKLPINCHYKCIDGDLYRICEDEEPEQLRTLIASRVADTTGIITYRDSTVRVCDTIPLLPIWLKNNMIPMQDGQLELDSDGKWTGRIKPIPRDSINCYDTVVVRQK